MFLLSCGEFIYIYIYISGFPPLISITNNKVFCMHSIPQTPSYRSRHLNAGDAQRQSVILFVCVMLAFSLSSHSSLAYQTSQTLVIESRKSISEETKHYHIDLDVLSAFICVCVWPLETCIVQNLKHYQSVRCCYFS